MKKIIKHLNKYNEVYLCLSFVGFLIYTRWGHIDLESFLMGYFLMLGIVKLGKLLPE